MESRARLFGHSIHQQLVVFPLGLLGTAAVFDVAALVGAGATAAVVAYWLIVAGVIGALLAAPFGLIDLMGVPRGTRAQRVGRLHGAGNLVVTALFAGSAWLRYGNDGMPTGPALLMSFAGFAIAGVTAWLGGELVSRLGVGVSEGAHVDAPSSLSGEPAQRGATSSAQAAGAAARRP